MKKFVLAFGIPVLAVASLIGSGYATWYFNNTVDPANKDIAVEPTEKKVVGAKFQKIELFGATKLVLDQTEKKDGMPPLVVMVFILKEALVSIWLQMMEMTKLLMIRSLRELLIK